MAEEATGTQAEQTNDGEQTTTQQQAEETQTTSTEQGEQPGEQQTTEETQVEGAPEKYEFTAPEGQELDGEFVKVYSEVARDLNLTQENAQKLIDKVSPVIQQQQMAKIEAIRTEWANQSKVDKEFGGEKLEENLGIAKQALDKFGSPALKDLLNASGFGNHPELIRFFYKAGKALSADTFVGGHQEGKAGPKNFNEMADALYG